jgi:hypothetical protein
MLKVQFTGFWPKKRPNGAEIKRRLLDGSTRMLKERQANFAKALTEALMVTAPKFSGRLRSSFTASLDRPTNIGEVPPHTGVADSIPLDRSRQLGQLKGYGRSRGPARDVYVTSPLHYAIPQDAIHGYIPESLVTARRIAAVRMDDEGSAESGRKAVIKILRSL